MSQGWRPGGALHKASKKDHGDGRETDCRPAAMMGEFTQFVGVDARSRRRQEEGSKQSRKGQNDHRVEEAGRVMVGRMVAWMLVAAVRREGGGL